MSAAKLALSAVARLRADEYRNAARRLLVRLARLPHGSRDSYTGRTWKRARRYLRRAAALDRITA